TCRSVLGKHPRPPAVGQADTSRGGAKPAGRGATLTVLPAAPATHRTRRLPVTLITVRTHAMSDNPATPDAHRPPAPASRSAMLIVFLVVFIDLLGFGIVLPLLPLFGESYVDALIPGGKENRAGGAILGLLMSAFSLMQLFFAP